MKNRIDKIINLFQKFAESNQLQFTQYSQIDCEFQFIEVKIFTRNCDYGIKFFKNIDMKTETITILDTHYLPNGFVHEYDNKLSIKKIQEYFEYFQSISSNRNALT